MHGIPNWHVSGIFAILTHSRTYTQMITKLKWSDSCSCSFHLGNIDLFRWIFDFRVSVYPFPSLPLFYSLLCCCCSHIFRMSLSLDSIWFLSHCEMHKSFGYKLIEIGPTLLLLSMHFFFILRHLVFGNPVWLIWCMDVLKLLISNFGLRTFFF